MDEIKLVFEQVGDGVESVRFGLDAGTILIELNEDSLGNPTGFTVTSAEEYAVVRDVLELIVGWLPGDE